MKANTELCVDLKTNLQNDAIMKQGKGYLGTLRRDTPIDGDAHFTFDEGIPSRCYKRNPRVYSGKHISFTRKADGTPQPNFRSLIMDEGFSIESYINAVTVELRDALSSLLGI